jgi:hypothetical protein
LTGEIASSAVAHHASALEPVSSMQNQNMQGSARIPMATDTHRSAARELPNACIQLRAAR